MRFTAARRSKFVRRFGEREPGWSAKGTCGVCVRRYTQFVNELSQVLATLHESGARYLVVGGVAVVLQGHPRFTADLALVLALDISNVL